MSVWVLMKAADGDDFLVNLDACAGIKRDVGPGKAGAMAVTITGVGIPLGEDFNVLARELTDTGEEEQPGQAQQP